MVAPDPVLKIPLFVQYSRKTPPLEHICRYKSTMGIFTNDEEILCKAFSSTLSDKTLTLFTLLKSGTVDFWHTPEKIFLDKFNTTRTIAKTREDLANIKQRDDESLLSFLERFKKMYDEIEGIS